MTEDWAADLLISLQIRTEYVNSMVSVPIMLPFLLFEIKGDRVIDATVHTVMLIE
jgi:hypothetical protein